jgi:hypothetical protein
MELFMILRGIYSNQFLNFNGCDSTVSIDLNINYSTNSFSYISSCDSFMWNGTTYLNSGSYQYMLTNSIGCDSIANLDLVINNSPILNITSGSVSCYDGDDGYIDLSSSAQIHQAIYGLLVIQQRIFLIYQLDYIQ